MTALVVTTPEAERDVRRIHGWWSEHRPAAPNLFLEEVADAFTLLAIAPEMGSRYPHRRIGGVRRLLLRTSKHHIYYVFDQRIVTVLAVWSAVRGRGPRLKRR